MEFATLSSIEAKDENIEKMCIVIYSLIFVAGSRCLFVFFSKEKMESKKNERRNEDKQRRNNSNLQESPTLQRECVWRAEEMPPK
jgi:hypothetical protein